MEQQSNFILDSAWRRYAQLDGGEQSRSDTQLRIHRWVIVLGILATLFAILTQVYPSTFPAFGSVVIKILLIITPILSSVVAAFANKYFGKGDWLVMRSGAEEIKKEIYIYRTILQNNPDRRTWLEQRVADILRNVQRGMGGELILDPYQGSVPPRYDPNDPQDDNGFDNLDGEKYSKFRLEDQLNWHVGRILKHNRERTRLQILILASGGAGSLLAALPWGALGLWVALSSSIAAGFLAWQQLRNLDSIIKNYSKVVVELSIIHDHWKNLTDRERTESEFFKMVFHTENILWTQNAEYIKSMQAALTETSFEKSAGLINRTMQESEDADQRMKESAQGTSADVPAAVPSITDASRVETVTYTLEKLEQVVTSEVTVPQEPASQ
jgi:hypothetical protein